MSWLYESVHELQVDTAYRGTPRVIDDDSSHVGNGLHRVCSVWRNDRRTSRTSDPSLTGYCNLQLAIDDVPYLVIRMGMLMDPGAGLDRVVGERHVQRMEETPSPAFPRLLHDELICFDEHHGLTI